MAEPTTTDSQAAQTTSDGTAENTGAAAAAAGAETQTAQTTEAQTVEKTFTQADVDRIVQNRLKSAVKAELKKLASDGDAPNVEDLQRQLTEATERARTYETTEAVRDYITDPKHKLNVRAENVRAVEKLVFAEIEYDDNGKPLNLKEAVESVKSLAPALFAQTNANINQGRTQTFAANDMNAFIRQQAGR